MNKAQKIFLMEDEEQIREIVLEYLQIAGYETMAAADGNQALEILRDNSFDLAILDIMVPGPNGIEILKEIQKTQTARAVIMLSALNDEKIQLEAFNAYADDYISKPFSPILLLKRIETILRRVKTTASPHRQEALYVLAESYQAFYDGKDLDLTLTEFQILESLYKNQKKVFTREELIEIIYEADYYGSDRIIDSHVKNLRKKLPQPYIKTVIGVGYQFDRSLI